MQSNPTGGEEHYIPILASTLQALSTLTTAPNIDKSYTKISSEVTTTNKLKIERKETIQAHTNVTHSASEREKHSPSSENVCITKDVFKAEHDHFIESKNVSQAKDPEHNINSDYNNEIGKEIPDSWENIYPDDTPSRAENFFEDLKIPLGSDLGTKPSKLKIEHCPIYELENLKSNNNWKDMFDPDIKNELKR